jgi:hypothetical protein
MHRHLFSTRADATVGSSARDATGISDLMAVKGASKSLLNVARFKFTAAPFSSRTSLTASALADPPAPGSAATRTSRSGKRGAPVEGSPERQA